MLSLMALIDYFFPKFCVSCKKLGGYICEECQQQISLLEFQECPKCRLRNSSGCFCGQVCAQDFCFDQLVVCANYTRNPVLRKAIFAFKYGFSKEIVEILGEVLRKKVLELEVGPALVVPVPLSRARRRFRGFNQAELLARYLAEGVEGLEFCDCLERKGGLEQVKLGREERLKNLEGKMKLKLEVKGRMVILVDDVATTGATLNVCSRELRGVEWICAMVLARRQ